MANSISKPKRPDSKRTTVRLRHRIEKRSAAKQRKLRKQSKKSTEWKSKHKKDSGIPNSFPYKEQILEEIEATKLRKLADAQKLRESTKAAKTGVTDGDGDLSLIANNSEGKLEAQSDLDDAMLDNDDDSKNPMAALLASARAAAEAYQCGLESGDDDMGEDGNDDGDAADLASAQATSRKRYDKVFKQVVDQADVVLYVLDARNPEGTRSREVERCVLAAVSGEKRLILVLNKIDLIPPSVLKGWLTHLRRSFPTLALRASGSAPSAQTFSHGELTPQRTAANLFEALKSFSASRNLKRAISVGVVGYPNVGKSSIINALLGRLSGKGSKATTMACPAGAEAGVTTSIRAVKIDSKLTLLDSPGIVFPSSSGNLVSVKNATEAHANLVLLNAVPPKQIDDPVPAVNLLIRRLSVSPGLLGKLTATYGLPPLLSTEGDITTDFLVQVARKRGRLGRGGVPNINAAAMTVVMDWRDGRIQGWTEPPEATAGTHTTTGAVEGVAMDEKVVVTEWAKEFKIEGLWGDGPSHETIQELES